MQELDEANSSPDEATAEIAHTRRTALRPVTLHPRERILDMLRTQRRPRLRGLGKQCAHRQRLIRVVLWALFSAHALRVAPTPKVCFTLAEDGG